MCYNTMKKFANGYLLESNNGTNVIQPIPAVISSTPLSGFQCILLVVCTFKIMYTHTSVFVFCTFIIVVLKFLF